MDLIDLVYHMNAKSNLFSNEQANRLHKIIRDTNKEYLYQQRFSDIEDIIFFELEKERKQILGEQYEG